MSRGSRSHPSAVSHRLPHQSAAVPARAPPTNIMKERNGSKRPGQRPIDGEAVLDIDQNEGQNGEDENDKSVDRHGHTSRAGSTRCMPSSLSRRDFLQATTAAGAFATLGVTSASATAQLSGARPPVSALPGWFDKPMRWAQLTLVENDPGRFDPQFWLDYFKGLHTDAACLSAGDRRLLPDRGAAASSQRVARRHRSVRHAAGRLPRAGHARHRAHGSACDER
jgi:hypothetical protein